MRTVALILAIAVAVPAAAQEQSQYEIVLAPFDTLSFASGNGVWHADLQVRNEGATAVNLFSAPCHSFGLPVPCVFSVEVPPGHTVSVDAFNWLSDNSHGVLFRVPRDRSADLHFNLRVRNATTGDEQIGTEIRVIREADLKTRRATMINVPLHAHVRPMLRIYSPDWFDFQTYIIRMYAEPAGDLLAERTIQTRVPIVEGGPPWTPVMVDASDLFRGTVAERVRVTVETAGAAPLRFWPLLTVTNSRNNQITTVTPD